MPRSRGLSVISVDVRRYILGLLGPEATYHDTDFYAAFPAGSWSQRVTDINWKRLGIHENGIVRGLQGFSRQQRGTEIIKNFPTLKRNKFCVREWSHAILPESFPKKGKNERVALQPKDYADTYMVKKRRRCQGGGPVLRTGWISISHLTALLRLYHLLPWNQAAIRTYGPAVLGPGTIPDKRVFWRGRDR
jgi:hypothetical protein